ncbi:MAG: tetratricopeptide repeat protein [Cyclobacteriaceae bacterium]|nr:tetratricopeptide repeat protein [Cyclobacteriaceae bacterium]
MKNIVAIGILMFIFSCTGEKSKEGDQFYDQGEYEKALESYDKFLTIYPRNIKTLYNRAMTYEKLGKAESAKTDMNTLLSLEPKHLQGRIALGEIEFRSANYKGAFYQFDQAVTAHINESKPYAYRAKANQKLGKVDKALADYGVAIRLNSSNGMAYLYRGTLFVSQKKFSAACSDLKIAKSLGVVEAEQAIKKYCK